MRLKVIGKIQNSLSRERNHFPAQHRIGRQNPFGKWVPGHLIDICHLFSGFLAILFDGNHVHRILILKETRGICFEDVVEAIKKGRILDDLKHKQQQKYPQQRILVIKINKYAYAVPYVINEEKGEIFLKTVYPSRVLTKKYLRKG